MPINLQGSGPIVEGWGRPPELQGRDLGHSLAAIIADRLAQQKMPLEIAKMIREQQEAESLAKYREILGQTSQDREGYMKPYYNALAQRAGRSTSRGGGGGSGSAEPQTVWKDGIEWRPGPGGRWIPMKPAGTTKASEPKLSPTEKGWAAPEIPGVSVNINDPDAPSKFLPPDTSPMPGPPSVPPLLARPQAVPQRPPAETGTTATTEAGKLDVLKERQDAMDAIANGKNPEAVKARFHERTGGVL